MSHVSSHSILTAFAFALSLPIALHAQDAGTAEQMAVRRIHNYSIQLEEENSALIQREQDLLQQRTNILSRISEISRIQHEALDELQNARTTAERDRLTSRVKELNAELSGELTRLSSNQVATTDLNSRRADLESRRRDLELAKSRLGNALAFSLRSGQRDVSVDDLDDALFTAAKAAGDKVPVTINSIPTPGALVYYITKRGRQRGETPNSLERVTNNPQQIYRGCYYMWAVWAEGHTTNKDRHECVETGGRTIDLR